MKPITVLLCRTFKSIRHDSLLGLSINLLRHRLAGVADPLDHPLVRDLPPAHGQGDRAGGEQGADHAREQGDGPRGAAVG